MPNNVGNARQWANAVAYVSFDLTAVLPANAATAWPAAWNQLGLLDGDGGFETSRSRDTADFYAWGDILFATTDVHYKEQVKFTTFEQNAWTDRLKYPGSSATRIVVPKPEQVLFGIEQSNGTRIHRLATPGFAKIDVDGSTKTNEKNPDQIDWIATIFPKIDPADGKAVLWTPQDSPYVVSIALLPITLALTVGQIKKVVATATYSDATTADISALVSWASSAPTKATVDSLGNVTGVAAGTTNISCSYGSVSSAAPSVTTVS
ncbi:MAG: Ig-like domain-containing protein [bacterium]|nr:Ig-like domain-containing protein [bacterium]